MSIQFMAGKLKGEERKAIIQGVQKQPQEAALGAIKPLLECQWCGHDVISHSTILEKYRRFWLDLGQQVLFGSGLCQSLRQMSEQWSAPTGRYGASFARCVALAVGLSKTARTEANDANSAIDGTRRG